MRTCANAVLMLAHGARPLPRRYLTNRHGGDAVVRPSWRRVDTPRTLMRESIGHTAL